MNREKLEKIIQEVIIPIRAGRPPKKEAALILHLYECQYEKKDAQLAYVSKQKIIDHLEEMNLTKEQWSQNPEKRISPTKAKFLSREWKNLRSVVQDANRKIFNSKYRNDIRIKAIGQQGLSLLLGWKNVVKELTEKGLTPLPPDHERICAIIEDCEESFKIRGALPDINSLILLYRYKDTVVLSNDQLEVLIVGGIRQGFPICYWMNKLGVDESRRILLNELHRCNEIRLCSDEPPESEVTIEENIVVYAVYFLYRLTHRDGLALTSYWEQQKSIREDSEHLIHFLQKSELDLQKLKYLARYHRNLGIGEAHLVYTYFSYLLDDDELTDRISELKVPENKIGCYPTYHIKRCFVGLSRELRTREKINLIDLYLYLLNAYCKEWRSIKSSFSIRRKAPDFTPAEGMMRCLIRMLTLHPSHKKQMAFTNLVIRILRLMGFDIPIDTADEMQWSTIKELALASLKKAMDSKSYRFDLWEDLGFTQAVLLAILLRDEDIEDEVLRWLKVPDFSARSPLVISALRFTPSSLLTSEVYSLARKKLLNYTEVITYFATVSAKENKEAVQLVLDSILSLKSAGGGYPIFGRLVAILSTLGYEVDNWLYKLVGYKGVEIDDELETLEIIGTDRTILLCLDTLDEAISKYSYKTQRQALAALLQIDIRHNLLTSQRRSTQRQKR